MVKYIEYKKVSDEFTTHEFRGGNEDVVVTNFTGKNVLKHIVSIVADDTEKIDELIASQNPLIECRGIVYEEFKDLVRNSDQIANINRQVKELIAERYDIADEIAMSKRDVTDEKRVAYENYVTECVVEGNKMKSEIGY